MAPKGTWAGQIGLALTILSAMSLTSLKGIELNKEIIGFFSAIIVGILALAGGIGLVEGFGPTGTDVLAFPNILSEPHSILSAILFFYFILSGFDDIIKFKEESVNPDVDIPKSFYISNGICALLTIGVAYAFLHVLTLKSYKSVPMENAVGLILESALGPPTAIWMRYISTFLMIITGFVSFLSVSRYLYGLGERKEHKNSDSSLSRILQWMEDLNEQQVPWRSVLVTTGLIAMGILMNHTHTLVKISDIFSILTIILVSGAVVVYKRKKGETPWIEGATAVGLIGILSACCSPF
jgi:amino acid transporter